MKPKPPSNPFDPSFYDGEEKLDNFFQIIKISNQQFMVRMDTVNVNNDKKKKKYTINDILQDGDIDELGTMYINKKKSFGKQTIRIEDDDDHVDDYKIAVYNTNNLNKPLSNIIKFKKYPLKWKYPPTNDKNYKPQPSEDHLYVKY